MKHVLRAVLIDTTEHAQVPRHQCNQRTEYWQSARDHFHLRQRYAYRSSSRDGAASRSASRWRALASWLASRWCWLWFRDRLVRPERERIEARHVYWHVVGGRSNDNFRQIVIYRTLHRWNGVGQRP